jgi:hypothetical protein
MAEITKEYLEEKIKELQVAIQQRIEQINQLSAALEQAKAERIQLSGQLQSKQEDLKELTKEE